jgi:hypothetical protein
MSDQLRLEGDLQGALANLVMLRNKIASSNLVAWIGHTNLCEAAIYLDDKRVDQAAQSIQIARSYYAPIAHRWGLAQCDILDLRWQLICRGKLDKKKVARIAVDVEKAGFARDAQEVRRMDKSSALPVPAIAFL